jgi:hypothetical protein
MRIIAAIALIAGIVGIWSATVRPANSPKETTVTPASTEAIDVIQMMSDSKNLPLEQFDAH